LAVGVTITGYACWDAGTTLATFEPRVAPDAGEPSAVLGAKGNWRGGGIQVFAHLYEISDTAAPESSDASADDAIAFGICNCRHGGRYSVIRTVLVLLPLTPLLLPQGSSTGTIPAGRRAKSQGDQGGEVEGGNGQSGEISMWRTGGNANA
jgi:hypothetical protein